MYVAVATLVVVGLLLLLLALNGLYKKTTHYSNMARDAEKYREGPPNGITMAVFGSTTGVYAYDNGLMGKSSFNFSGSPQSLYYDRCILEQYRGLLAPGCTVFITLPILVFCYSEASIADSQKYDLFLDKRHIPSYSRLRHFLTNRLPILLHWKNAFKILRDSESNVPRQHVSAAEAEGAAKQRVLGWEQLFGLQNMGGAVAISTRMKATFVENQQHLKLLIDLCRGVQARPVLVIPPVSAELNALVSEETLQACLYDNIRAATAGLNVPLLDYLRDPSLQAHTLYLNADNLNPEGSRAFTRGLLADLERLPDEQPMPI